MAGLLTADVLAGKDVGKAIAERAAWRDDERGAGSGKENCPNRVGGSNKERRTYDDYS